ncbi:MAG: ABC transporter permease [Proteobacteria bacterium]|nr:ABC transporter permease [Pseudomonadota bacterium]
MSAFLQLLRWDFTMQLRHGLWVAAVFVLLPWVAVLLSVSQEQASFILPGLIFLDVSVAGMLFMAGVYFFEKREGSLHALVVTPIKTWQWLVSKLVSLTVMGMVMCVVLVVIKQGMHAPWGYLLVACLCINVLFILLGFVLAAPQDRFSNFFLYYALVFGVMEIPCLSFFDISHSLFWLLPTQPALVLLRGAFDGMAPAHFAGVVGIQLLWIALGYLLCLRLFHRNIADRRG